jgi:hypothetical protein
MSPLDATRSDSQVLVDRQRWLLLVLLVATTIGCKVEGEGVPSAPLPPTPAVHAAPARLATPTASGTLGSVTTPATSTSTRTQTPTPTPEIPPTSTDAVRALAEDPTNLATRWLASLEADERDALVRTTELPFEVRTTAKTKPCDGIFRSLAELIRSIECLRSDELLMEELRYFERSNARALSAAALPAWTRRHLRKRPEALVPVRVFINGDGVSYVLVFLVGQNGVRMLLLHTEHENG